MIERILKIIEQSGQSDYSIQKACNLSNGTIYNWKKGISKPDTEAITKLAKYFKVTTDYLLTGTDNTIVAMRETEKIQQIYNSLPRVDQECVMENMAAMVAYNDKYQWKEIEQMQEKQKNEIQEIYNQLPEDLQTEAKAYIKALLETEKAKQDKKYS